MPKDTDVKQLIINQLTKEQYNSLKDNNQLSNTELYIITDDKHLTDEELIEILKTKQDKLTTSGVLSIDENNVLSIDLTDYYTKTETDSLLDNKANKSETGYSIEYIGTDLILKDKDGNTLSTAKITSNPEVDKISISYNKDNNLQSIGEITKRETPKYTWIGTTAEYEQALQDGNIIDEYTEILITDSKVETVTPNVTFDAPTKLSELANDTNFITQNDIQNLTQKIEDLEDNIPDDTNIVHKTGNEHIDGFKSFSETITIKNGLTTGKISHKNTTSNTSNIEDGYIRFGDNTLVYGKQSTQGDLYNTENDIFHKGNLVAGENINITEENGIYKINGEAGSGEPSDNKNSGLEVGDIGVTTFVIDESKGLRRYLNGSILTIDDNTNKFLEKLKATALLYPSIICSETEWQSISSNSIGGQCGKFVLDETNSTIRLPKIIMPIQNLSNLANLGEIVEAGLPNITGDAGVYLWRAQNASGAFQLKSTTGSPDKGTTTSNTMSSGWIFDASLSNSIYGNSITVQQEQVQYPYFIQIATGLSETVDITNEYQLNNPFYFGMSQYSKEAINNSSWLKSNGQWNKKELYPDYYNWLLTEKNNPTSLPTSTNVKIVGIPIINKGVISQFTNTSYVKVPSIPTNVQSFEWVVKFTTGTASSVQEGIIANDITNMSSPQFVIDNNRNFAFGAPINSTTWGQWINTPALEHTTYKARCLWDGIKYSLYLSTNNAEEVLIGEVEQDVCYWVEKVVIGNDNALCAFSGSIDLNETYININGQRWWSGVSSVKDANNTNDVITDYDYVINTENQTFRLPLLNGSESLPGAVKHIILNGFDFNNNIFAQYLLEKNGEVTVYAEFINALANDAKWTSLNNLSSGTITFSINGSTQTQGASGTTLSGCRGEIMQIGIGMLGHVQNVTIVFIPYVGNGSLYYYVGDTVQNINIINTGRILESLAEKIDKRQASIASMPSTRYNDLVLGESLETYIAPENGYFAINKAGSSGEYIFVRNLNTGIIMTEQTNTGLSPSVLMPVSKGDSVLIIYNLSGATSYFRFYYAQGVQ